MSTVSRPTFTAYYNLFQSLVRVVLNEHLRPLYADLTMAKVSIPRSGCAE